MEKSGILVIGATGNLGYELAKTSIEFSHPTFALVRDSAFSDPNKSQRLQSLSDSGVTILKVWLSLSIPYMQCRLNPLLVFCLVFVF